VPLVVESVGHPWTSVIKSVGPEMRHLGARIPDVDAPSGYSALALPFTSSAGNSMGSLYMLPPRSGGPHLDVETRILSAFSRVIREIIERQRAARHSADVYANIATLSILDQTQFKAALLKLLRRKAGEISENERLQQDVRLPFLLLSAQGPDPDEYNPVDSDRLENWLIETLRHLEWRSFVQSRLSNVAGDLGAGSFMGELPSVGMVIALNKLVSKDEMDRIRNAFPTTINRTTPTNAPVKLVPWVLDVPAQRILDAANRDDLQSLAEDVEGWVSGEVATVVDDDAQSAILSRGSEENGTPPSGESGKLFRRKVGVRIRTCTGRRPNVPSHWATVPALSSMPTSPRSLAGEIGEADWSDHFARKPMPISVSATPSADETCIPKPRREHRRTRFLATTGVRGSC